MGAAGSPAASNDPWTSIPRVALLFLVQGDGLLANEALWAAFLDQADGMQLRRPPPVEAVRAAAHVDLEALVGGPLKPALQPYDEAAYQGYAQQHLMPPPGPETETPLDRRLPVQRPTRGSQPSAGHVEGPHGDTSRCKHPGPGQEQQQHQRPSRLVSGGRQSSASAAECRHQDQQGLKQEGQLLGQEQDCPGQEKEHQPPVQETEYHLPGQEKDRPSRPDPLAAGLAAVSSRITNELFPPCAGPHSTLVGTGDDDTCVGSGEAAHAGRGGVHRGVSAWGDKANSLAAAPDASAIAAAGPDAEGRPPKPRSAAAGTAQRRRPAATTPAGAGCSELPRKAASPSAAASAVAAAEAYRELSARANAEVLGMLVEEVKRLQHDTMRKENGRGAAPNGAGRVVRHLLPTGWIWDFGWGRPGEQAGPGHDSSSDEWPRRRWSWLLPMGQRQPSSGKGGPRQVDGPNATSTPATTQLPQQTLRGQAVSTAGPLVTSDQQDGRPPCSRETRGPARPANTEEANGSGAEHHHRPAASNLAPEDAALMAAAERAVRAKLALPSVLIAPSAPGAAPASSPGLLRRAAGPGDGGGGTATVSWLHLAASWWGKALEWLQARPPRPAGPSSPVPVGAAAGAELQRLAGAWAAWSCRAGNQTPWREEEGSGGSEDQGSGGGGGERRGEDAPPAADSHSGGGGAGGGGWRRYFRLYVHLSDPAARLHPGGVLRAAGAEVVSGADADAGARGVAGQQRPGLNTSRGYAQHVLVQAELRLLAAALADPLVVRLVLLSETSIPVRPAPHVWAQLMWEQRSRVDACRGLDMDTHRWRELMATPHLTRDHWRKSSQWFALTRQHAALAVADRHVSEVFHRHCYTRHTTLPTAAGGLIAPRTRSRERRFGDSRTSSNTTGAGRQPADGARCRKGQTPYVVATAALSCPPEATSVGAAAAAPAARTLRGPGISGLPRPPASKKEGLGRRAAPSSGSKASKAAKVASAAAQAAQPNNATPAAEPADIRVLHRALTSHTPPCVSDEHYLATLLAAYSLDGQSDCVGEAHFADWTAGLGWHPRSFLPWDMTGVVHKQEQLGRGAGGVARGVRLECALARLTAEAAAKAAAVADLAAWSRLGAPLRALRLGAVASASGSEDGGSGGRGQGPVGSCRGGWSSSLPAGGRLLGPDPGCWDGRDAGEVEGRCVVGGSASRRSLDAVFVWSRPRKGSGGSLTEDAPAVRSSEGPDGFSSGSSGYEAVGGKGWRSSRSSDDSNSDDSRHSTEGGCSRVRESGSSRQGSGRVGLTATAEDPRLLGGRGADAGYGQHPGSTKGEGEDDGGATEAVGEASTLRSWLEGLGYVPLGYRCHLFARKFPLVSAPATFRLAMTCPPHGLGLGPWCQARAH